MMTNTKRSTGASRCLRSDLIHSEPNKITARLSPHISRALRGVSVLFYSQFASTHSCKKTERMMICCCQKNKLLKGFRKIKMEIVEPREFSIACDGVEVSYWEAFCTACETYVQDGRKLFALKIRLKKTTKVGQPLW